MSHAAPDETSPDQRRRSSSVRFLAGLTVALAATLTVWFFLSFDDRGRTARLEADAPYYHAYTVSLFNDGDLDFTNEYRQTHNWYRFGQAPTGKPSNVFGIGPGLYAAPFFLVGRAAAHALGVPADGFSEPEVKATTFASLVYTLGALLFAWRLCRRRLRAAWASWLGPVLILLGTSAVYYAIRQPGYAHPFGAFWAAWLLDRWDASFPSDGHPRPRSLLWWVGSGLLVGALALARPQLVLWGLVLGWAFVDDLRRGLRGPPALARAGAAMAGALLVFSPQLVAWKSIYGAWYLIPQGPWFMRWDAPAWSEVIFSSRNGLFAWTPLAAVAAVGLLSAGRRQPRLVSLLLAGSAAQVVANGAVWDWWAGGSFGARRFDSCFIAFAFGLAALLDAVWAVRPRLVLAAALTPLALLTASNVHLAARTSSHSARIEGGEPAFAVLREKLPPVLGPVSAWFSYWGTAPPRFLFRWRHGTRPWDYDRIVGTYFLGESYPGLNSFRPATTQTVVPGARPHNLIGFSLDGPRGHMVSDHARVLVPLNRRHGPVELRVQLTLGGPPRDVVLRWNGAEIARVVAPAPGDREMVAQLTDLIRGVNTLEIEAAPRTALDRFTLTVAPGVPP